MGWGTRRRLTPEEVEANAEAKRIHDALCMTCQVCGRQILANTEKIAHHGYQRPYEGGYQTASCFGARHLPYQADREILGEWIVILENSRKSAANTAKKIKSDEQPCHLSFEEGGYRDRKWVYINVTAENFEVQRAAHGVHFSMHGWRSYEDVKKSRFAYWEAQAKFYAGEKKQQQSRFDAWKLTHAYNGEYWTKGRTTKEEV